VLIYTIGFGTPEGERVPELDDAAAWWATSRTRRATRCISRMDETTLQEIAERRGGQYYRATADGS
jgi:hypothetical protein